MAVYAICTLCGVRRTACDSELSHKRHVKWRADVHFTNGERLRKSFTTKELADIQERQWKTDYERGLLLPSEGTGEQPFLFVADEWWSMAIAQGKIKNPERTEIYRLNSWKEVFKSKPVSQITLDDLEKWRSERLEKGYAINTVNRDVKTLQWIMKHAQNKNYISKNPFESLSQIKNGNIHDRWLTSEEIKLLIESSHRLKDFNLIDVIAVALNTGFRKGNLERLTARDITEQRIMARVTKSGEPYDVPITPDLKPILDRLVLKKPIGKLLNTEGLDKRFRTAARLAGLYAPESDENGRKDMNKVTIHTLRHTYAVSYLRNGGDIYKLSKLLGHASVLITDKVYARMCPKQYEGQARLATVPIPDIALKFA